MRRAPRRPLFHFAPDGGWINDPNGLVRHAGRWHAFYQKSLEPPDHRVIGWGHAVSDDLIAWTDLGMAIAPDDRGYAYSGCIVPHDGALAAFLTRHDPVSGRQAQELALSTDDGASWRIAAPRPLIDEGLSAFRDPFVVKVADGSWRMILVKPVDWHRWRDGRSRFALYRSDDLNGWTSLGPFGPEGRAGELYEVPLLLRLPVVGEADGWRWLLVSSIVDRSGDGVACRTVAWIGDLIDDAFVAESGPTPLDYGPDFYAATSFAGLPEGETILIAWLNSWAYARRTPGDAPLGGTLTIPRRLALRRDATGAARLVHAPAVDLATTGRRVEIALRLDEQEEVLPVRSTAFAATFDVVFGSASRVEVGVRRGAACRTLLTFDADAGTMTLDRSRSGATDVAPAFAGAWTMPLTVAEGSAGVTVLVDRCSVEVFAQDGSATLTALFFPDADGDRLTLRAVDGTAEVTGSVALLDG